MGSVGIVQDFFIESVRIVQECLAFFHCHKQVMTKYRISFDFEIAIFNVKALTIFLCYDLVSGNQKF